MFLSIWYFFDQISAWVFSIQMLFYVGFYSVSYENLVLDQVNNF